MPLWERKINHSSGAGMSEHAPMPSGQDSRLQRVPAREHETEGTQDLKPNPDSSIDFDRRRFRFALVWRTGGAFSARGLLDLFFLFRHLGARAIEVASTIGSWNPAGRRAGILFWKKRLSPKASTTREAFRPYIT